MRASMPRVSQRLTVSLPIVPWFERATATRPPHGVPLSATRMKYIVISTLRHWSSSAGSCTYMRGTEPLIFSSPWPSTEYDALPWFASNHASDGSTPENVRGRLLSHFENHSLPPDTVG